MMSRGKLMLSLVSKHTIDINVNREVMAPASVSDVYKNKSVQKLETNIDGSILDIDSVPILIYDESMRDQISKIPIEYVDNGNGPTCSAVIRSPSQEALAECKSNASSKRDPDYNYDNDLREIDVSANESDDDGLPVTSERALQNDELGERSRKKRSRKSDPKKWRHQDNKRLRSEGKAYMGYRRTQAGQIYHDTPREARKLGHPCLSKESERRKNRKCSTITENQRKEIFGRFWDQSSWDQRKNFVVNHIRKINKAKTYTDKELSRRNNTLVYHLTVGGEKLEVCKKLFLSTTGLGEFAVHSWVKGDESSTSGIPNSTEYKNSKWKRAERPNANASLSFARAFFNRFPKLPSHYARASSSKLYFEPFIRSMNQLFSLYLEACREESQKPLSRWYISNLFHEMNLSIHPIKKDNCDTCVKHEVGQLSDEDWQLHRAQKDRARLEKAQDKEFAQQKKCVVLTMDLQAVKVSPWVQASAIFYKTKLCCHNFTVYNLATRAVCCYWFDETAADMTASTFTSCILEYLERFSKNVTVPIVLFSDGCTYQNRNAILSNELLSFAVDNNKEIIQKFLVVGHTQMECDSVHSRIEKEIKGRDIYIPQDYIRFTKDARKEKFPYEVRKMVFSDFKDLTLKEYQRYSSIRPGKVVNDPMVTDLRALRYLPAGEIQFKLDFDHDWSPLPQRSKTVTAKATWPRMYQEERKIKKEKYMHLQELKKVIPQEYHAFYDKLKY